MPAPKDPIKYAKFIETQKKSHQTEEYRQRAREISIKQFSDPKQREKQHDSHKGLQAGEKNPMFGMTNEKCPSWKGNDACKNSIHKWVKYWKGSPRICEDCGKYVENLKLIDWSNKDHLYKRNLDDYVRRCRKCHSDYDILYNSKYNKI